MFTVGFLPTFIFKSCDETYLNPKMLLSRPRWLEVLSGMEPCSLFSQDEIEPFKKTREVCLKDISGFTGFAEIFSTFGRLSWLESSIPSIICASRVPRKETRKLLRCRNPDQASNVPVFQFMRLLFDQIGFKLVIIEINPFQIIFGIKPPIYDSPVKQKKTCFTTAEAICRFFQKDLGLKCDVDEIGCVNEGAEFCMFKCNLELVPLVKIVLDEHDKELIGLMAKNMSFDQILKEGYFKDPDELKFRLDTIKEYGIIDDALKLTERGKELIDKIGEEEEEEDFEPPWKGVKDISSAVSLASSFAEAMKETSNQKKRSEKK